MESSDIPLITEEVFLVLKPNLPTGTVMSSAFRDAPYQLRVIREQAETWNRRHPRNQVPLPANWNLDNPDTWAPTLIALRSSIAINAPYDTSYGGNRLPGSTHSSMRAVFDLSHPDKTEQKIIEISKACAIAEKKGLVGYNQLKPETKGSQMAVHVDVKWVSSRALYRVRCEIGFIG